MYFFIATTVVAIITVGILLIRKPEKSGSKYPTTFSLQQYLQTLVA